MPIPPQSGESKQEFMDRCIPEVLEDGTATGNEEANTVCNAIYNDQKRYAPFMDIMQRKKNPK